MHILSLYTCHRAHKYAMFKNIDNTKSVNTNDARL